MWELAEGKSCTRLLTPMLAEESTALKVLIKESLKEKNRVVGKTLSEQKTRQLSLSLKPLQPVTVLTQSVLKSFHWLIAHCDAWNDFPALSLM